MTAALLCLHWRAKADQVFVANVLDDGWHRQPVATADPTRIIRCYECPEPAVQVDHCWPHLVERTLCAGHLEAARNE